MKARILCPFEVGKTDVAEQCMSVIDDEVCLSIARGVVFEPAVFC